MYKLVLFDYGNTLCSMKSLKDCLKNIVSTEKAELIGKNIESQILTLYKPEQKKQPDWLDIWDKSFKKFNEYFDEKIGIKHLKEFCDSGKLYNYSIDLLTFLKQKKIKIVLISNMTGPHEIYYQDLINKKIYNFFDKIVWSCEVNFRKPSTEIFKIATGNYNKSEILMVGDNEISDILGAKNYGIDSMILVDKKDIESIATYKINRSDVLSKFELLF